MVPRTYNQLLGTIKSPMKSRMKSLRMTRLGRKDASAESGRPHWDRRSLAKSSATVWGTDWTAATIVDQLRRQTISRPCLSASRHLDRRAKELIHRFIEALAWIPTEGSRPNAGGG